ncbi:MAG TPA: hypothetical protein P5116_07510 [Eubacteriales bacterium]|nr:hypothetical protein [Clostridia bacterium]HRV73703.1 hypothetical protein [Eubacteriales bacterium]
MKKTFITILAAMVFICALGACSAGGASDVKLEGTLPELIEKIYEKKDTGLALMTTEVALDDAYSLKYYTGLDSADKLSAAAVSEAMIGSQAYSLVLVRVKDNADAQSVAESMKAGIDTAKWVCVMADDLQVAAYGDVVLLIMVDSALSDAVTSDEIVAAFQEVCGGKLTLTLK